MIDIEKEQAMDKALEFSVNNSPSVTLIKEGNELSEMIVSENDPSKIEDLTNLFKLNQRKKNIIRANKLSGLLELVDSEVIERFSAYPESFDNDQLIKYMESTTRAISNIEQSLDQKPLIQINNQKNEINIGPTSSGLTRESREKVLAAVQALLSDSCNNSDIIDAEVTER